MAPGAFAAQTLLDAAEYRVMTLPEMRRQMVVALMQAAMHVSSIDTNLDQAVSDLKASGVPRPDLEAAICQGARVIRLVEEAAQLIRRRLR
jgi:hypothetical protein